MAIKYDVTGSQSAFHVEDTFTIFKVDQIIHLSCPGYLTVLDNSGAVDSMHSLRVYALVSRTDGILEEKELTLNNTNGWVRVDSQEDIDAKSEALSIEGANFIASPEFVTHIKILAFGSDAGKLGNTPFKVVVKYQTFKKVITNDAPGYEGEGPNYSPSLMASVLDRVAALENVNKSGSLFGTAYGVSEILDEDVTGQAVENFVQFEQHTINTVAGINIIQPQKGSFYPSKLSIIKMNPKRFTLNAATAGDAIGKLFFYSDTERVGDSSMHLSTEYKVVLTDTIISNLLSKAGQITGSIVDLTDTSVKQLVAGIDYTLTDIDISRTARTVSPQGVYKYIRILTSYVGDVLISYQAFGGAVGTEDFRLLHQEVKNTKEVLGDKNLLTVGALAHTPIVKEINRRLTKMEEFHNHFSQVEHHVATNVPGYHWFNIAAIYDVNWGTVLTDINEIGQFRVKSAKHRWAFEFMVDVDMSRPASDVMRIKILGTNQDSGIVPKDYLEAVMRDNVAVRLCYIGDGSASGVVLQLGWDFSKYIIENDKTSATDTIIVTNKSGNSSYWTLLSDEESTNYPAEGLINVYNHLKLVGLADGETPNFESGKYYRFSDTYAYVHTGDKYSVNGKQYFIRQADGTFVETTVAAGINIDTEYAVTDPATGILEVNLYERVLYGHYPILVDKDYYEANPTTVLYKVASNAFSEDTAFSMPNKSLEWKYGSPNCKSCVRLLSSSTGVMAWFGSVRLSKYTLPYGTEWTDADSNKFESYLTLQGKLQSLMQLDTIRKMSAVVYDRLDNTYRLVTGYANTTSKGVESEILISMEDICMLKIGLTKIAMTKIVVDGTGNETSLLTDEGFKVCIEEPHLNDSTGAVEYNAVEFTKGDELVRANVTCVLGTKSLENDRFELRQIRLHF